jgi:lipid A 4'-phosphatase
MNRTGLKIALAIAFVVGLLCAVDPQLDLDLAGLAFNPKTHMFGVNAQLWVQHTREAARLIITLLVLPAFLAVLLKLILPRRRMLIEGRAALFLIATLALGPGVLTNLILKDHWGRARPIDVQQFGGDEHFTPWWDPRGDCPNNCSFIAGEPSGAFWTLAPAALAPVELLPLAYGAALVFGAGTGVLRMAAGAHFFSDVVFAGVFMYLLVWIAHGLIYRWPATRISEEAIEAFLVQAGDGLRDGFSALAARVRQFADRSGKGL